MKLKTIYELMNSGNANFANGPVDINNYAEMYGYYEAMKTIAPQYSFKCSYYQELLHVMAHVDGISYVFDVLLPGKKLAKKLVRNMVALRKAA